MARLTKLLATCWPLEQVLLVRAGHTYAQTAPYAKSKYLKYGSLNWPITVTHGLHLLLAMFVFSGVTEIITPLFMQYGEFNTG